MVNGPHLYSALSGLFDPLKLVHTTSHSPVHKSFIQSSALGFTHHHTHTFRVKYLAPGYIDMLTAHYGIEPTTFWLKDALPHSHSRPYVQQHVRCNVILHVECTWMQMYLEIQYTAFIEYVKV